MELLLARVALRKTSTIGALIDLATLKRECYILEDVVREVPGKSVAEWKIAGKTAIPAGRYRITWSLSPRLQKFTLALLGVEGFTGIRIHSGNTAVDTAGCLITGTIIGADNDSVVGSGIARDALEAKLVPLITVGQEVWLTVV